MWPLRKLDEKKFWILEWKIVEQTEDKDGEWRRRMNAKPEAEIPVKYNNIKEQKIGESDSIVWRWERDDVIKKLTLQTPV